MKTKITVDRNNVTVVRDDVFTGERRTTVYFAPHTSDGSAGYVRIRDGGGYSQVCERLESAGSTLMATPESLPRVIRRELRRRNAADAREMRA